MPGSQVCKTLYFAVATALVGTSGQAQQIATSRDETFRAAPHEGGVRRWRVGTDTGVAVAKSPAGAETTGVMLAEGAVLTNFGCLEVADAIWCEVQPMRGGPRGFVMAKDLEPLVGPDGLIARGPNDSAERAKRKLFDATAEIQCAQEQGQALGSCHLGVARSDGGDATAAVTFANGFTRFLFFMHGEFISASATMSGAGRDTEWRLENGTHYIRADDQRFEIADALLLERE